MITISRKLGLSMLGSLALAAGLSGAVAAQDMPASGSSSMSGMSKMGSMSADKSGMKGMDMKGMKGMKGHMMGMHSMPATVNAVDASTGVVDVTSEGMALKVHFPVSAEAGLKAGDKIVLHMAYSKP